MRLLLLAVSTLVLCPAIAECGEPALKIAVLETKGIPSEITVQVEGKKETTTFKNTPKDSRKAVDDLVKYLNDEVKRRKEGKLAIPKIEFQIPGEVLSIYVVKMLEEAKQAGFEQVSLGSLATKKPEGK